MDFKVDLKLQQERDGNIEFTNAIRGWFKI